MADNTGLSLNKVEYLTGSNYGIWALKISAILRSKRLYRQIIEGNEPDKGDPPSKLWEKWEERNDDAFGIIIINLSPEIAGLFIMERDAKKVWLELKRMYAGNEEDKRIDAMLELKNLKKNNLESVEEFILRARNINAKCMSLGQNISERELVFYVVRGLDDTMENVASVLRPQRSVTLDEVKQTLLEEEIRIKMKSGLNIKSNKMIVEKAFRSKAIFKKPLKDKKCFICGKIGHLAKYCWFRKDGISHASDKSRNSERSHYKNRTFKANEQAKLANDLESESALTTDENDSQVLGNKLDINEWNLDSGCTSHMTPMLNWLEDLQPLDNVVNLAEQGRQIEVKGRGTIHTNVVSDEGKLENICIHNVLYVPKLKTNLLSVKSIVSMGNRVIFDKNGAQIINGDDKLIARINEDNRMYILKTFSNQPYEEINNCLDIISGKDINKISKVKMMWHRRLGHLNEKYLNNMYNNQMVKGLELDRGRQDLCDSCTLGKMCQMPFPITTDNYINKPLELVHMDLCGPMPYPSLGGARYMFVLVDSFSRRIFTYFLQSKNETFEKFKLFKNRRENELGLKLKMVKSDNGGEFVSNEFERYLEDQGIKHQKTVAYTPQSNGTAERANRTILDKIRTLLIDSNLPKEFWAEAAATATYAQNRTPTKSLGNKTPLQMWTGRIPNVAHMRIFGCLAYYYIEKNLRGKLDPKSRKGIFVGYSNFRKAYRIYDEDGNVHEVRTVKFDEGQKGSQILNLDGEDHNDIEKFQYYEQETNRDDGKQGDKSTEQARQDIDKTSKEDTSENKMGRKKGTNNQELQRRKLEVMKRNKEEEEKLISEGIRRSERIQKLNETSMITEDSMDDIPKTFEEAKKSKDANDWIEAMDTEMESLKKHKVWKLVQRKDNMKIVKSKWIFSVKKNPDGTNGRKKARLVATGYNQKPGIDFQESFSPVMKIESLRSLLAIASHKNLKIRTYDVKTAYLYGEIEEDIYLEQPKGYIEVTESPQVCKLEKSLYGLPQSGRNWNIKVNKILEKIGLKRSDSDPCIYYTHQGGKMLLLGLYVDDQIVLGTDNEIIDNIMSQVKKEFTMTEDRNPKSFLGIELEENKDGIFLSQKKYVEKILIKHGLAECKPTKTPAELRQNLDLHQDSQPVDITTYQELLGSLMYVSNGTRPDITYNVNKLSQYMKEPKQIHLQAVKRIYRYLKGTKDKKLFFSRTEGKLRGSADASWCTTKEGKSFGGYVIKLGDSIVSWKSKKQGLVALSTMEAEMMAICEAVREMKWLTGFISEIGLRDYIKLPLIIYSDSKAAIDWVKAIGPACRTKHINRKFYFIKDELKWGNIELIHCNTENMEADFLTKDLCERKMNNCNLMIKNQTIN